ncbi:hypothetical protein [Bradyrhizobium sp. 5.13L]
MIEVSGLAHTGTIVRPKWWLLLPGSIRLALLFAVPLMQLLLRAFENKFEALGASAVSAISVARRLRARCSF